MNSTLIAEQYSPNLYYTPEGYLVCANVPIARTGYQRYAKSEGLTDTTGAPLPDLDGWIEVYKDASVLFSEDTMSSFENKPVVLGHKMVSPENWSAETVGVGTNIRRGPGTLNNNLFADLIITNKAAIDLIKKGTMREISLGYDAAYKSDGPGLAHQISIIGNHIAIVPQGKAGSFCRIYDSVDESIKAIKRDNFMSFKEKLKQALGVAVDSVTLDEENDEKAAAAEKGGNAAPAVNAPASTAPASPSTTPAPTADNPTVPPTAPAVNPNTAAAEATGTEPPMSPAAAMLNAKLDQLLDLLTKLSAPTTDKEEKPAENTGASESAPISIDPSKPMRG